MTADRDPTHEAVTAVLRETPQTSEGWVATWYDDSYLGSQVELGSAEPIAARQAAAVLRWAARHFGDMDGYYQYDQLSCVADEIDPKESRDDHR